LFGAQSASLPHVVGHVSDEPLHTYAPHPVPVLPCESAVHVPAVALHVEQPPVHAVLQHSPLAQKPLVHCVAVVQVWPVFRRHAPVDEHVLVPVHESASSALETVVHVPGVAPHVLQVPLHGVLQQ
jgi:hypothetical protein